MDETYPVNHPAIKTYMETENPVIDFDSYTEILDDYGYFKEDYYGKTPYLLKAEKVLESLMTLVKQNPLDDYTNHPLNIKLQKLLQKQFGFKDVFILWFQDSKKRRTAKTFSSVNIFSGLIDETRFKNKKDGFYDTNHKLICCITISISNMVYADISAEECMAILLHEIGHNFDYSINHAISTILGIVGSASRIVSKKSIVIGKRYDPESDTTTLYRTTIPIIDLEQVIYLAGVATPIRKTYAKFISLIDKLLNKFPFAKKVENVFGELISYYDKMYYMITSFRNLKNLPRQILLTPLSAYAQIFVIRKNEEFADSFATMYGYGPSLMTGLTKLDYTAVMNLQDTEIGNNPVVKALLDITMLESCICSFFLSGHGTDEQRIMQQIKFVKKEISNGNYPPSIKEELKNQVNELEEILRNNVEMTDEKVKLPFTIFVRRLISKIFHNDTEMISKLFPENLANISLEFAVDDADGDPITEAVDLTNAFRYYHGEPERQGFKPESSCRAWDKDLYSKSIDYEVLNSLDSPHVSDKDEYILHLYTLGDETHSMYIGSVNVKREGNKRLGNKSFDWEWNEQLPIDPTIVSYLREEIQTESTTVDIFNDILEFNDKLNKMEYIIPNNGNIITQIKANDFLTKYYLLTPDEFIKYNGGICWDYVTYEAIYFKKYFPSIKFKTFYHEIVDNIANPTHTFLIFKYHNYYYWFESSWKTHIGIYKFKSENDALNYIINNLIEFGGSNMIDKFIVEYDATNKKLFGMNCIEYMTYMASLPEYKYKQSKNNINYIARYNDDSLNDSQYYNESVFNPDHETEITDKSFKYIDIKSASADKYLNTDAYYKKFSEYIRNDCVGEIVVCVNDDKLAGYIIVDNKNYPGFIVPLEVMKPYRGLGLSKKLLNDAIRKYGAIDLCVYKNNEIAINLYKKFGFVIIGDGDKKNRYYMKLKSKITKEEKDDAVTEACKDLDTARKFVNDVGKLAKKYNANYFVVTDGASGISNQGNEAVRYHREKQIEWEKENGFDPDEDWSDTMKENTTMESAKRSELKDSDFGLPKERKYPLDTKEHVLSAIKFFNYVSEENEEELARNINEAIGKFFDSGEKLNIHIGKNNRFSKYFNVDLKESTNIESEGIDMSNLSEYTDKIGKIREIYKSIAVKRMTGELTTEAANETLSMLMEKALNASEEFIATESGIDLIRNKFKPSKIRTAKGDADGYVSNLTVGGKRIGLLAKNVTGKEEITASQLKTDAAILNKGFKQLAEDAVVDLTKMAGRYKMDPKSIRKKMKLSHVEYKPTFDKAGGVKSGEFSIWYNDEKSADVNFFGGHSYVQRVTISDGKIVKASGSLAN